MISILDFDFQIEMRKEVELEEQEEHLFEPPTYHDLRKGAMKLKHFQGILYFPEKCLLCKCQPKYYNEEII